jgi:hypothetical protein
MRWGFLLEDNLQFFLPRFRAYALAIEDAANTKAGSVIFQRGTNAVCTFIDCNNTPTATPGDGPSEPGVDAERNSGDLQVQNTASCL